MSKHTPNMSVRDIDAHSINCIICGELADERECLPGDSEGEICPNCQKVRATAPDLLKALSDIANQKPEEWQGVLWSGRKV